MRSNKKPIPTEPYPRLIWYQEKKQPSTPEEIKILTDRYYDVSYNRLEKIFPNAEPDSLHELAVEKAKVLVECEINLPTIMKKVLVESKKEHIITKDMLEKSDNFLQWYQE